MNFHELINSLVTLEAADRPGDMFDQLTSAYDNDISLGSAKIGELEAANAALTAEVARLKSHNYDLLTATAQLPAEDEPGEEVDEPDSEEYTIENAFQDKE